MTRAQLGLLRSAELRQERDAAVARAENFRRELVALLGRTEKAEAAAAEMREHHRHEMARVRDELREAKRRVKNAHKATAAALGSVICVLDDLPDDGEPEEPQLDPHDREIFCRRCQQVAPCRFAPSPDAGPYWRCSQCGEVAEPKP